MDTKLIASSSEHVLLQKEVEFYRAILNNMGDLIACIDIRTKEYTYMSPSYVNMLNLDPDTVIPRKGLGTFTHIKNAGDLIERYNAAISAHLTRLCYEIEMTDAQGNSIPMEVVGTIVYAGPEDGTIVVNLRNILERKNVERTLRRREEDRTFHP